MSELPFAPSRVYYNGVDFGPETETLDCSIRPIPDASGRTVKYVQYSLSIRTIIAQLNQANGQTTDAVMEAIQTRLTQYGGEFRYEQVGLGDLVINIPDAAEARDVVWGPKTQLLRFKPLGQYACELNWQVQFCIPVCPEAAVYQFGVMEYVYSWRTSINRAGETTRTLTGRVAVPQTRGSVSTRTLSDQADRLRERIAPGVPVGFQRVTQDFALSEDKCELSWTIVDQESEGHGNYPPAGVLSVEASHDLRTSQALGAKWTGTLRASYEMAKDAPREIAVAHFLELLKDRRRQTASSSFTLAGGRQKCFTIPFGFEVSEPQIYGRRSVSLSCSYLLTCSLPDVFAASGLWRPVPGSNWQRWASSLSNAAWAPRGNAGLAFSTDQDYVIDLCSPPEPGGAALRPQANDRATPPSRPGRGGDELKADPPTPEVSWLRYESWLRIEQEDGTTVLQPLPASPSGGANAANAAAPPRPAPVRPLDVGGFIAAAAAGKQGSMASADGGGPLPGSGAPLPPAGGGGNDNAGGGPQSGGPVIQRTTATTFWAVLHGFAVRAGFPASPPSLVTVGGRQAFPANDPRMGDGVSQCLLGAVSEVAVVVVRWQLRYVLDGAPFNVPYMDSPFAG